jgi:hypothetical protein
MEILSVLALKFGMSIRANIWYELVNVKFGDEYLVFYLARERQIRKWFRGITIICSTGGIFSASISAKIPTIVSCSIIGLVQAATSIENFIIRSEKDIEEICKLRMMYYDRSIKLEQLWHEFASEKISEDQASNQFFALKKATIEIEKLDNKLNIKRYKLLKNKADKTTRDYIKTISYE